MTMFSHPTRSRVAFSIFRHAFDPFAFMVAGAGFELLLSRNHGAFGAALVWRPPQRREPYFVPLAIFRAHLRPAYLHGYGLDLTLL
jgi:hypothetical protein